MELLLKRYFWVIPILVIALATLLAAKGANHWFEGKYLLDSGQQGPRAPRVKKAEAPKPVATKDADAVLARNLFCSACEPATPVASASSQPATSDDGRPPNTTLPLALLATAVTFDPRYSSATLVNTASLHAGLYRIDEVIPEVGPVVHIAPRYVDFRNLGANGRVERVDIMGAAGPAPKPVVAAAAASQPSGNPEADLMAEVDKAVKKVDDTHYEIDRSLVDKILADPTVVARGARIVPSVKDGKANGFKIYAIRPNSPYAKIGLQNGDTIASINGYEMTSPDKALEVYTKVKSASSLSIAIVRRGENVTMEYTIK